MSALFITIQEKHSQKVLKKISLEEKDLAYKIAREFEEYGLEVEIVTPTIHDNLLNQLNINSEQKEKYLESLKEEIESHEDSCCFE